MFYYDPDKDGKEAKDLFDKLYKDIKFDKKLYKELHKFRLSWVNKSSIYTEFLGGNTIGVHPVRFSTRDDELLLTGIYNVDPHVVNTNILRLPDIGDTWAVSNNPVYQTMCYTMHRFIVDGKLGNKLEDALKECYYIFSYKVFGSLLSHYFSRDANPSVAKAATEKLSNRYLIKQLGSWEKVLEHRAQSITPPKGLHTERLKTYTADDSVRIINDLQGGIRSTLKYISGVMADVEANTHHKISTTSMIEQSFSGDDSTKDIVDRPDKYVIKLKTLMGSSINLVDENLIYLVAQLVPSSDAKLIKDSLLALSDDYDVKDKNSIYLEHVIIKTIAYCNSKGISADYRKNIVSIIDHMKGYWTSGSVKDRDVKLVKKVVERAVKTSTKRKTKWVIASNTLAVIIYLFIRSVK